MYVIYKVDAEKIENKDNGSSCDITFNRHLTIAAEKQLTGEETLL